MIDISTINSHTKSRLMLYKTIPQSIIIHGAKGLGKEFLTLQWLKHHNIQKSSITYLENEGIINVEQIRELYKLTKSKRIDKHFVVLKNAETMNVSAQNAFLKLLEEPIDNIHFILLVNNLNDILQTIRSRTQIIEVLPIKRNVVADFIGSNFDIDKAKLEQILFMSEGKIGKATKLTSDESYFKNLSNTTKTAKLFLTSATFQRVIIISEVAKSREECLNFLEALMNMAERLILTSEDKQKWIEYSEKIIKTAQNIKDNGNTKIQMTNLSLEIN